jgi:hypothetical protein
MQINKKHWMSYLPYVGVAIGLAVMGYQNREHPEFMLVFPGLAGVNGAIFGLRRWLRARAARRYLDELGDDLAREVRVNHREVRDSDGNLRFHYAVAHYTVGLPWLELRCVADEAPAACQEPGEVEPLRCWGADTELITRLWQPEIRDGLLRFLRGEGKRSIEDGRVVIELLLRELDTADVVRLLDRAGA